ncbi:hypothetical protein K1719_032489 [Acacia pycnantha]|nr:hypothetical protein K1719_032489 [Acacia pycnantha]
MVISTFYPPIVQTCILLPPSIFNYSGEALPLYLSPLFPFYDTVIAKWWLCGGEEEMPVVRVVVFSFPLSLKLSSVTLFSMALNYPYNSPRNQRRQRLPTRHGERVSFTFNPKSDLVAKALHFSPFMSHKDYKESCVSAFICVIAFISDLTANDLNKEISPSSVDIVTMIFMLSAVSQRRCLWCCRTLEKL